MFLISPHICCAPTLSISIIMKKRNVVDQLVDEYLWTIGELAKRRLA